MELDEYLLSIFVGLSQLLIDQGFSYGRLSTLMKIAFIDAARGLESKGGKRNNIARIATLTGLTRLEVSRIIKSHQHFASVDDQANRATRVALGWMKDSGFTDVRRQPRALSFSTDRGEFQKLVKKYSGDIPARAMLSEMLRLGMVKQTTKGQITLVRKAPRIAPTVASAIRAIAPWVNQIAEASSTTNTLSSRAQKLTIRFGSMSEVLAATRELEQRWTSFVAAIRQLGTSEKEVGGFEATISTAIATTQPTSRPKRRR